MASTRTRSWRRTPTELVAALLTLLAVLTFAAGRAAAAGEEGDSRLTGRWSGGNELLKGSVVFLPDGRYFVTYKVGESETHEKGRYTVARGKVTFRPQGEQPVEYGMGLRGEKLTLTNPNITLDLSLEPGSRRGVIEEVARADAAKAKEDAEWAKRFPLAKPSPRANLAIGDLPRDPDPERVFKGEPTVFGTHVSYVRFWNPGVTYQVIEGPDPGRGKAQTNWHFLPNGRFFHRDIKYVVPDDLAGQARRGRVEVTEHWGRYRVDRDEKGREVMVLETDAGEKIRQELIDGRRNLLWDDTIYGNTLWELYALQKQEGQNPELPPIPR